MSYTSTFPSIVSIVFCGWIIIEQRLEKKKTDTDFQIVTLLLLHPPHYNRLLNFDCVFVVRRISPGCVSCHHIYVMENIDFHVHVCIDIDLKHLIGTQHISYAVIGVLHAVSYSFYFVLSYRRCMRNTMPSSSKH